MIKPSELRIGNYVYDLDENHNQVVKRTYHIDENYIKIEKPIPLTEEWLLRFGFEKDSNGYFYHKSFHIGIAKQHDDIFHLYKGHGCVDIKIINVHQLQNLYFALTGEELVTISHFALNL